MLPSIINKEYFPLTVFREYAPNNKYSGEKEIYKGEPFTGIVLYYYSDGQVNKYKFVQGILHGEYVYYWKNKIGMGIFFNGVNRFFISVEIKNDKNIHEYFRLKNCFDELIIEDKTYIDGKLTHDLSSVMFTNNDLNFRKITNQNQDVISFYEKQSSDFEDINILIKYTDSFFKNAQIDSIKNRQRVAKTIFAYLMEKNKECGIIAPEDEFIEYYVQQDELREKVIRENRLPEEIRYIAGVDVAYHDLDQQMVGAVVVLDIDTLEEVDSAVHQMEVTFPYIPGLFSFREIPAILEAYKKLKILPDLIVCDGQGIAHPKNVGMTSHLGLELDIPTIGCAKKRLVGYYEKDKLGKKRGDTESLIWHDQVVGKALRTQDNVNPVFVSIGHKIDLDTAIEWILKLTPRYRLPETTRQADHLVNQYLKERTDYDFYKDEEDII